MLRPGNYGTVVCLVLILVSAATCVSAQKKFVYPPPSSAAIDVKEAVTYSSGNSGTLKFNLYRPKESKGNVPILILLNGIGADWIRSHVQYEGWGRHLAASGLAGITMDSKPEAIAESFDQLVEHLRSHAREYGLDTDRIAVYACSSNVRAALPLVMSSKRSYIKAAVIYYGFGDPPEFRLDLPVLFVRAGLDVVFLNRSLGAIYAKGLEANAPVELINYSGGHHGFEIVDDTNQSRQIIDRTLQFVKAAMQPAFIAEITAAAPEAGAAAMLAQEKWPQAITAYSALVQARPQDARLRKKLGDAYNNTGDYKRAATEYQKALDLGSPDRGLISVEAALGFLKAGDKEEALKWLANVRSIPPVRNRLRSDPAFDSLRDDARFKSIVEGKEK